MDTYTPFQKLNLRDHILDSLTAITVADIAATGATTCAITGTTVAATGTIVATANGSARVRLGQTDVISSVKAELGKPSSLQPDKGKGRGGEELSTELSASIYCPTYDFYHFAVCPRICILIIDGNLLDALGSAIKAALSNTGIPRVRVAAGALGDEKPEVDISEEEFLQFDASDIPVIVPLTKVGWHYIVDATSEEESQMSSAVSISINRKGHICGLTKRGGAGLDPSIILDMMSVVKHVSEQLINQLDSKIAAAKAGEEESWHGLDPSIILDMMSVVKHVSEQLINQLDSKIAAAKAGEEESWHG
nr:exosome complex component rrp42 [Quercus suber]